MRWLPAVNLWSHLKVTYYMVSHGLLLYVLASYSFSCTVNYHIKVVLYQARRRDTTIHARDFVRLIPALPCDIHLDACYLLRGSVGSDWATAIAILYVRKL